MKKYYKGLLQVLSITAFCRIFMNSLTNRNVEFDVAIFVVCFGILYIGEVLDNMRYKK